MTDVVKVGKRNERNKRPFSFFIWNMLMNILYFIQSYPGNHIFYVVLFHK